MPSQIKVDEIKNVAGQYEIKTNTFKGQTTAGSIAVQGEGSATTNLQQGLSKALVNFTSTTTTAIRDSFNISSLTDVSTGKTQPISFTSNMNSTDYYGSYYNNASTSGTAYTNMNNNYAGGFGTKATSSFGTQSFADALTDSYINDVIICGDLA
jgi:hypothetical protein